MQAALVIGLTALLGITLGQGGTDKRQQFQGGTNLRQQFQGGTDQRQQFQAISFPGAESRSNPMQEVPCSTYKGEQGTCNLIVQCATFFAEIAELSRSPCLISEDQQGVCCLPEKEQIADPVRPKVTRFPTVPLPPISQQQINSAANKGVEKIKQKEIFAQVLANKGIVADVDSPVKKHAQLFPTTKKIIDFANDADKGVATSIELVKEFNLTKEQGQLGLPGLSTQGSPISNTCPQESVCQQTRYRTFDGSCNNLRKRDWGKKGTAFARILPPDYSDGVNGPRVSRNGSPLPSARLVSSRITVENGEHDPYRDFTMLIMQWGQFLDHDITHTPITKGNNNADITCCTRNGQNRSISDTHPDCLAINIPPNDSFYAQFGRRCMEFVRSLPAVRPACNFGPREQINQITTFIDASNVYGSDDREASELRSFQGGKLKAHSEQGRSLLPPNRHECVDRQTQHACFKAGDGRVNEQPNLAVLHIVWMRQHNLIADKLQSMNPRWNDNQVFQEARRIIIAQMQHITYKEYLPIVLGKQYMEDFGLFPQRTGFSKAYREDLDPSIFNVFATAAFRYGHTLISDTMKMVTRFGSARENLPLSPIQFRPFMLYQPGSLDEFLRGLSKQPSEKFDNAFSEELTNKLFAGNSPFGMDLVALNIQRGRDHGLPDYNSWRKECSLPRANSFGDLRRVMKPNVVNQLERIYNSVDDIDLFIGAIAETPLPGTLLGPTFHCIVGDQFARLKLGDRFWYENGEMASSFTESQLMEIRKTSLSRILCDNSDNLEMIQPLAFNQAFLENKRALCRVGTLIPIMSLEPWRNAI